MTDNRTTELRWKLKERGIEYEINDCDVLLATRWRADGMLAQYLEGVGDDIDLPEDDSLVDLAIAHVTPEQAIAATLGSETNNKTGDFVTHDSGVERTCRQEERGWGTEGDHARVWLTCGHDCMVPTVQDLPNYCPECGAKVVEK